MMLVACGPALEPAESIGDIQKTAKTLAQTSIAFTKAAIPTDIPSQPKRQH